MYMHRGRGHEYNLIRSRCEQSEPQQSPPDHSNTNTIHAWNNANNWQAIVVHTIVAMQMFSAKRKCVRLDQIGLDQANFVLTREEALYVPVQVFNSIEAYLP